MYVCSRFPRNGATDICELPHGYWELNLGPLKEWPVLWTVEPSLHLPPTCLPSALHLLPTCTPPAFHLPSTSHIQTLRSRGGTHSTVVVLAAPGTLSHQHLLLLCLWALRTRCGVDFSCWTTPFSLIIFLSVLMGERAPLAIVRMGRAKPYTHSSV